MKTKPHKDRSINWMKMRSWGNISFTSFSHRRCIVVGVLQQQHALNEHPLKLVNILLSSLSRLQPSPITILWTIPCHTFPSPVLLPVIFVCGLHPPLHAPLPPSFIPLCPSLSPPLPLSFTPLCPSPLPPLTPLLHPFPLSFNPFAPSPSPFSQTPSPTVRTFLTEHAHHS